MANASRDMLVIVDESKLVERLGHMPLPVEITPFAWKMTLRKLANKGFSGVLRPSKIGPGPYLTDNGNYIADIHFAQALTQPEELDLAIRSIPGVIETGFFFNLAKRVVVGFFDGRVELC